jgi:thiosulfate/3-mercaptopyruvate sulfurtransferase
MVGQDAPSQQAVIANLGHGDEQVVDARGEPRFTGAEQESRPGLASGHIPGSRNVPYKALYNEDGTFKSRPALLALFGEAGIDLDRPLVTTCGSGMTACALAFALHLVGKDDVSLYDGSWSEWGADPLTPKSTGPA